MSPSVVLSFTLYITVDDHLNPFNYRHGTSKRMSYIQVRKGLIRSDRFIEQDIPCWL